MKRVRRRLLPVVLGMIAVLIITTVAIASGSRSYWWVPSVGSSFTKTVSFDHYPEPGCSTSGHIKVTISISYRFDGKGDPPPNYQVKFFTVAIHTYSGYAVLRSAGVWDGDNVGNSSWWSYPGVVIPPGVTRTYRFDPYDWWTVNTNSGTMVESLTVFGSNPYSDDADCLSHDGSFANGISNSYHDPGF